MLDSYIKRGDEYKIIEVVLLKSNKLKIEENYFLKFEN